jgi:outer membrane immunogenic protein
LGNFHEILEKISMKSLKKVILGAVALVAIGIAPSLAADLPAKTYTKAPAVVPAPIYDWTGFYIGGDVGWFGAGQSGTTTPFPAGFGPPAIPGAGFAGIGILPTAHNLNTNGALGGVHAGYNWQFGKALVGIEGDAMWLASAVNSQTTLDTFNPGAGRPDGTMSLSENNRWLASARGRLGYVGGKWMGYVTGGAAWKSPSTATWTPIPGALGTFPSTSTASFGGTRTGYVVGAGVEWAATSNWLFRVEYLHYGFSGDSTQLPFVVSAGNGCTPTGTCGWNVATSRLGVDTVRAGVSYKFGGPIIAKY